MTCELCNTAPATMWVLPVPDWEISPDPQLSCDDCGPQLGYKILASLEPTSTPER